MARTSIALLGALLPACHNEQAAQSAADQRAAAAHFVPPQTQAPSPMPGQANATPLGAYVGHFPGDPVDGISFLDRTEVSTVILGDVTNAALRQRIIHHAGQEAPIAQIGNFIASHGCGPAGCAADNWTVMIVVDGNRDRSSVCSHTAAMGERSRWYARGRETWRAGGCPSA